ncbi:MAG: adenylate/guanylate cyclase domain-containing protein [Burkholderiales bacterium]
MSFTHDGTTPQQRRMVSVLFLDVVESTALSRDLDPEDVADVFDGALARFGALVQQYGGRVLRFAGDGLLAAFGADRAREDDAERAVHAGLAMLEASREHAARIKREHRIDDFKVRVGVHTGYVLLGGGVDGGGSIRGFTVNIAARLEQTAPPGHLRISYETWRQVRGLFDVEAQPPLYVKGQDEPLQTYLVQSARPRALRIPERGVLGHATPLVGRDAELAQLVQAFETTAGGGGLQAVTLTGDAGLGKSRLLREFQHRLDAHARRAWLLLGRSQPGNELQPYGLLRDVLAWRLQIPDSASADVARAQLVQGLAPHLGPDGATDAMVLGQLVGMDFASEPALVQLGKEPRLLRDRGLAVFTRWLSGLAASDGSPVVLMLDDLQWADDASLDCVTQIAAQSALPLTLVIGARPSLLDRRPKWGQGWPAHRAIALEPLDATMQNALGAALLARLPEVPADLASLIERRAEGNPYYAEELVQMLIDDGVIDASAEPWRLHGDKLETARIPETLVGVLQARLDAVPEGERRALQQASIVGPVFWDQAVAVLQPDAIGFMPALQSKSMVQMRPASTFEGTSERAFHHHLLHQVTYDTVLKADRRSGHARAARWLAERVGDRGTEYLTVTAGHYERAGDFDEAMDWYERALDTAIARFANRAAIDIAERMLALPTLGDTARRYEVLRRQSTVADLVADRELQARTVQERLRLAELLDDDDMRAESLVASALLHDRIDERDEARRLAEAALAPAERADNAAELALAHGELAWLAQLRGDHALARRHVGIALPHAARAAQRMRRAEANVYEVSLRLVAAMICQEERDFAGQRALAEEALALAEQRGLIRLACLSHEMLAVQALKVMDLPRAERHLAAGRTAAASIGFEGGIANADMNGAQLARVREQWASMLALAEEAGARYDRMGMRYNAFLSRLSQGVALIALDRPVQALVPLEFAEAGFMGFGADADALCCRLLRAEALWRSGDLPAALAAVRAEADALAQPEPLDKADEAVRARAAAWHVLRAAGDDRASAQLALAVALIDRFVESTRDPDDRARVLTQPLRRELLTAAGRPVP